MMGALMQRLTDWGNFQLHSLADGLDSHGDDGFDNEFDSGVLLAGEPFECGKKGTRNADRSQGSRGHGGSLAHAAGIRAPMWQRCHLGGKGRSGDVAGTGKVGRLRRRPPRPAGLDEARQGTLSKLRRKLA